MDDEYNKHREKNVNKQLTKNQVLLKGAWFHWHPQSLFSPFGGVIIHLFDEGEPL